MSRISIDEDPEGEEHIFVPGIRPSGGAVRPSNTGNIPPAPHVNPGAPRPELGGGGDGLYQGNITIKGSAPPPAKDGKAYAIAGTIIGGARTGTAEDETITGATIEDATIIVHPDSAHPLAGGKTVHTKLSDVTLHISPKVSIITHCTIANLGIPIPDKATSAGGAAFEPIKTGLPTDILIDPGTFYPKPGEPFSPPVSPEKPEKSDPAPAPPEPEHKKKHHHHHHKH